MGRNTLPILLFLSFVLFSGIKKVNAQSASITIPNVFTPNGDTKNDFFSISANGELIKSFDIKIYNSWGVLMFTSQNINVSWDGRTTAGIMASEGSYFYIININDKPYSGTLLLYY